MDGTHFEGRLLRELEARRKTNPRYSLRAFAVLLGADHSTLSQVLRGKRPISVSNLRRWARKLALSSEEVAAYITAEHVPLDQTRDRQEGLRHWSAEALAIIDDRIHWHIIQLVCNDNFRADSRWMAAQLGVGVDRVNVALSRLLRLQLLEAGLEGRWKDLLGSTDEAQFRRRALVKVRELAVRDGIKLGQSGIKSGK